jgi:hypothetical protein
MSSPTDIDEERRNRWGACGYVAPYGSVNLATRATTPLTGAGAWAPQLIDLSLGAGLQAGAKSQMGTLPGQ